MAVFQSSDIWKLKGLPIRLKPAAWLADFPVGNTEISIPDSQNPTRIVFEDFLGPAMDLGFRLSKLSSPRKFVISVDLALMLLTVPGVQTHLYFDGMEPLHGVLSGKPYPIIWIDMYQGRVTDLEDKLRGSPPEKLDLKAFCLEFLQKTGGSIPFIEGDPFFNEKPPDWETNYQEAIALILGSQLDLQGPPAQPVTENNNLSAELISAAKLKESN